MLNILKIPRPARFVTVWTLLLWAGVTASLSATEEVAVDLSQTTFEGGESAPVTKEIESVTFQGQTMEALKLVMESRKTYNAIQIPVEAVDGQKFNTLEFQAKFELADGRTPEGMEIWVLTESTSFDAIRFLQRGKPLYDGWYQFSWDFKNQPSIHAVDETPIKEVRIRYPFDGIPEGKTDTVIITNMKFVAGKDISTGDPQLTQQWKDYLASYKPDYSDSSKFLEPPTTGRLAHPLPLAKNGKALAQIVLPADASDVLKFAARELQYWLGKITGADFPTVTREESGNLTRLHLGRQAAAGKFEEDLAALGSTDGFAIRTQGNDITIFGATDKGTLNGIYAFLENNSDIIWPRPRLEMSAVFTPNPQLAALWGDAREVPATELRGWGPNLGIRQEAVLWMTRNRNNYVSPEGLTSKTDAEEFQKQGLYIQFGGGHNIVNYLGKNPDFYPVIDGKKVEVFDIWKHQPNFTAPGITDAVADNMLKFLQEKAPPDIDCVTINIEDNWGVSTDPKSLVPITLPDGTVLGPNDPAFRSTQFFMFLNEVAKRVNAVYPNMMIETYAYFFTAPPPKVEIDPHIRIMICPYPRTAYHLPLPAPINAGWWDQLVKWAQITPHVTLREYYGIMNGFRPQAEVAQFDIKSLLAKGIKEYTAELMPDTMMNWGDGEMRGTTQEFDFMAMDYWVISRLLWNPDQDVEQLRKYYLRRTFHEAAPEMERFFGLIRTSWFQEENPPNFVNPVTLMKTMIIDRGKEEEMRQLLTAAAAAVKNPTSRVMVDVIRTSFEQWVTEAKNPPPATPAPTPASASVPATFKFTAAEQLHFGWFENTDWESQTSAWATPTVVDRDGKTIPAIRVTLNPGRISAAHAFAIFNPFAPGLLRAQAGDILALTITPAQARELTKPLKIVLTAKDEKNTIITAPPSAFSEAPGQGSSGFTVGGD